MKHLLAAMLSVLGYAFAKAQSPSDPISFIEEKGVKRWNLYAQNNTDTAYEAFLLVKGEGFRRSADRPVIKKIPPHAKVLMATLIPLKGTNAQYTKIFTYEEQLQTIEKKKNDGVRPEDAVQLDPVDPKELTIFIEKDCPKCDVLISYLNERHVKYRKLDIHKNHAVKELLFKQIAPQERDGMIALPVVCKNGKADHSITDIKSFLKKIGL